MPEKQESAKKAKVETKVNETSEDDFDVNAAVPADTDNELDDFPSVEESKKELEADAKKNEKEDTDKLSVKPEIVDPAGFVEVPESIAAHFGQVGFQRLLVDPSKLSVGNGTVDYLAIPIVGLEGEPIELSFQNGIPSEVGVNGLSIETVLRAAMNRLRHFQKGEFACEENKQAISAINKALSILCKRSLDRSKRGVEGTLNK